MIICQEAKIANISDFASTALRSFEPNIITGGASTLTLRGSRSFTSVQWTQRFPTP